MLSVFVFDISATCVLLSLRFSGLFVLSPFDLNAA
jgi:hypothetical protein